MSEQSIGDMLEELARALVDECKKEDANFSQKLDAFKALVTYQQMMHRGGKGANGAADTPASFGAMKGQIDSVGG